MGGSRPYALNRVYLDWFIFASDFVIVLLKRISWNSSFWIFLWLNLSSLPRMILVPILSELLYSQKEARIFFFMQCTLHQSKFPVQLKNWNQLPYVFHHGLVLTTMNAFILLSKMLLTITTMYVQVRYLQIAKKSRTYNPYRWVRYVTQANSYVARIWWT